MRDEATRAAERILEAFRDNAFVGEQRGPVPIGASIGVATYPADGRTATELIAAADKALYRVKRDGGHDAAQAGGRRRLTRADGRLVRKYQVAMTRWYWVRAMDVGPPVRHPLYLT